MKLRKGVVRLIALVVVCCDCANQVLADNADADFETKPGVTAAKILRARGYLVSENYVVSRGGYMLRVTRATNPLVNEGRLKTSGRRREPILFVHGILENDSVFVINSKGARPKDFRKLNLTSKQVLRDPSAKSLPLLALNFGHTVYLLSRRGAPGSQKLRDDFENTIEPNSAEELKPIDFTNLSEIALKSRTSFGSSAYLELPKQLRFVLNTKFWNYSFDEQIRFDFPKVVDFVLRETNQSKLALVGHSAGGTIPLAAMSRSPKLTDKLSATIFWAEGSSLGHGDIFVPLQPFEWFFNSYIGPLPSARKTNLLQTLFGLFCRLQFLRQTVCQFFSDLLLGPSGGDQPLEPDHINTLLYPTSSHEFAQIVQCTRLGGKMHKYDYGKRGNLIAYNRTKPPLYDLSKIKFKKMSFYTSSMDAIVSQLDAEATRSRLKVAHKYHVIGGSFNHQGYFYHKNTARLVIVPSLKEIHEFSSTTSSTGSGKPKKDLASERIRSPQAGKKLDGPQEALEERFEVVEDYKFDEDDC